MWRQIGVFTLNQNWQYSRPIDGVLFRVRHLNVTQTGGQIAQGVLEDGDLQLFEKQRLLSSDFPDLFEFVTPLEPGKRRIALRADAFSTPWRVALDYYDGGTVAPDYLALHNAHLNAFSPHPQYLLADVFYTGLISQVSQVDLTAGLALKADLTALALKADLTVMNSALALKADLTAMNSALVLKVDLTALALKADVTAMNSALALKADLTALALKANVTAMNTADRDRNFQRKRAEVFSDFITNSNDWISATSGTNSNIALTAYLVIGNDNESGVAVLSTGTTDIGAAGFLATSNAFKLGSTFNGQGINTAYFRAIFQVPTISTAIESFLIRLGFIEALLGEPKDAVFLRITPTGSSEFVARNNNIESVIALSTAIAAEQWYNLEITVPSSIEATLRLFTGLKNTGTPTDIKTLTTNIPYAPTRGTGAGAVIQKLVGLTARTLAIDFLYAGIDI